MTIFIDWGVILLLTGYYLQCTLMVLGIGFGMYLLVGKLWKPKSPQRISGQTMLLPAWEWPVEDFANRLSTRHRFVFGAMILLIVTPIVAYPLILFGSLGHRGYPRRIAYLEHITTTHIAMLHPQTSNLSVLAHYASKQGFYQATATVTVAEDEGNTTYRYICTCPELSDVFCFGCEVTCRREE